jgi:hypothetical protein
MNEEKKRILQLLAEGKISAAEAEELLESVAAPGTVPSANAPAKDKPKWLRVKVNSVDRESGDVSDVNLRVPLLLIRGGAKLAGLLPEKVREKVSGSLRAEGVNFDLARMSAQEIEDFISLLADSGIHIESVSGGNVSNVSLTCE